MRTAVIFTAMALVIPVAANAQDAESSREIKLSKGKAKVKFSALGTEGVATGPQRMPAVGIAPSPNMVLGNYLAKSFDDARKVAVVPPSRFGAESAFAVGYDSLIRSDLEREVGSACKSFKLNYLMVMSPPDTSFKTDATAFVFGLGRTRYRNTIEARMYDCPTGKIIWNQRLLLESSQSMMGMTFGGASIGTGESERAFAGVIVEKIAGDLKW